MTSYYRGIFSAFCFLLVSSSVSFSQSFDDMNYRRFSIALNSGASFGDHNRGERILASNFSTDTKDTFTFGGGLQYAVTPAWSVELGYQRAVIRGVNNPFETNMNLIELTNIINLNQILLVNLISDRINPFLTMGFGYDFYTYNYQNTHISNHNSSLNAGAGLAYRLSNSIDLFTHYKFHIGSNSIDNDNEGWGADLINSFTGGIRLNLGKGKSVHPSWRALPVSLSSSDYQTMMAQADRINKLEEQLKQIENQNNNDLEQSEIVIHSDQAAIDSLKIRMTALEKRMDDLERAFVGFQENLQGISVDEETGMAELLPAGHYVQIFAANHLNAAQKVRSYAVNHLQSGLPDVEEKIFVIRRKQFYEVLIGVLSDFEDASSIQVIMSEFHADSYVISFPRAINLAADFEDLNVVH
jgi:opacity protein-like surface antigen